MRNLSTGTVTLLFTDIEGSTLLLQQLGERYAAVLAECRQLLRDIFQRWHGHEVDTRGDAFFVAFARATDAVSAAVAAQHSLAAHTWPEGARVRVRMGLHTGEPSLSAEGYVAVDVHNAAHHERRARGPGAALTNNEGACGAYAARWSELKGHGRASLQGSATCQSPLPTRHCWPARRFPSAQNGRCSSQQPARSALTLHWQREGGRRRQAIAAL